MRALLPWAAPLARLADLALPPRCPGCGEIVGADHRFCADCWGQLRFLGPPWCARCQLPFDYDRGEGAECAECIADPPPHDGVRAAVAYGDVARHVALRLKYGGKTAQASEPEGRLSGREAQPDRSSIPVAMAMQSRGNLEMAFGIEPPETGSSGH